MNRILRRTLSLFLAASLALQPLVLHAPAVLASPAASPAANITALDIDNFMRKLLDPNISDLEKKRITAIIFVNQDIYRNAVTLEQFGLKAKSPQVDAFLQWKTKMQIEVAERMNQMHRNLTGENLKAPIVPFAYNNILSDDDIITGSGPIGKTMEKLYVDSLDQIIRERAGRPMTVADRHRVDVNGLAWDMTQEGALDNYWHKEKYINPQSGFANQKKLIEAGDKVQVISFDENGKAVMLKGEEAKKAIMSLSVDRPLDIGGMNLEQGTGSMSDYFRMADIHQVKFGGTVSPEQIAQFIRNQKYTQRVVGDFLEVLKKDLEAREKSGKLGSDYEQLKAEYEKTKAEFDAFINTSAEIRSQTTARAVAEILQRNYKIKILNADGTVDFDLLKKAMQIHQQKQLTKAMPKMIAVVSQTEAFRIADWVRKQPKNSAGRNLLRKQLALTYAPFPKDQMRTIIESLERLGIPPEDLDWITKVIANDAEQIRGYAKMMKMPTEELVKHLKIEGDNLAIVDLLEATDPEVKALVESLKKRAGGTKFQAFLRSKTAKALNLDVMLGDEATKGQKFMLYSMILLALSRAYMASERNDEAMTKMGMALFEMIPFTSAVLRFSELEYKEAFKQLAMDIFPPLALAHIAGMFLGFASGVAKSLYTENAWEGLVNNALRDLTDADFEKTEMGYYRLKDRDSYLRYLEEVQDGFGRVVKLASLMAPEVDAMMSRHPQAQINEQALYTIKWFDGDLDFMGLRNSLAASYKLDQIKARVWEKADPRAEASPTERVAAKIILDNLAIRAELYTVVLENFIDRIEKAYNAKKKDEEDQDAAAILAQALAALERMNKGAPQVIKDNPWAKQKLDTEYERITQFVKGYKVKKKQPLMELRKEMQGLIDEFGTFIKRLAWAVELYAEKQSIDVAAVAFGGEKSTQKTKDVLLTDPFRLGLTARVLKKRESLAWTVFYYALEQEGGDIKLLGKAEINKGQTESSGDFFLIKEGTHSTEVTIDRGKLKPLFEKEGDAVIFPVLAYGNWGGDPMHMVGYAALEDPSEFPQFFATDRIAYLGAQLTLTIRRPKVVLRFPPVVYRNDKAKAKVHLEMPAYASIYGTQATFHITPPMGAKAPRMNPDKLETISLDEKQPSESLLEIEEEADEGNYLLEVRVRLAGLPDEAQPMPHLKNFEYSHDLNPELSDDIQVLLTSMKALESRAGKTAEKLQTEADRFLKPADAAIKDLEAVGHAVEEIEKVAAALEPTLKGVPTAVKNMDKWTADSGDAGTAIEKAHDSAEQHALKVCESAKAMKDVKDIGQLRGLINSARTEKAAFEADWAVFEREFMKLKAMNAKAQSAATDISTALEQYKKTSWDTGSLTAAVAKAKDLVADSEQLASGLSSKTGDLTYVEESATAIVGKARGVVKAIKDPQPQKDAQSLLDQIEGSYKAIQGHVTKGKGRPGEVTAKRAALSDLLAKFGTRVETAAARADAIKAMAPDEKAATAAVEQARNIQAAYDTAVAYGPAMVELGKNCDSCGKKAEEKLIDAHNSPGDASAGAGALDCSAFPGTEPRKHPSTGQLYCACLNGGEWNQTSRQCNSPSPTEVGCPQGEEWNNAHTACRPAAATQVAQANCSAIAGSSAGWDAANERPWCYCPSGQQVNAAGTACQDNSAAQVAATNCRVYPGTSAQWDPVSNSVQCMCPSGQQWNGRQCVMTYEAAQSYCNQWPGSTAQSNGAGGYTCQCASGTQWDQSQGRCAEIQQAAPQVNCGQWPGTQPQTNPWNSRVDCVCPDGQTWDQNLYQCAGASQQATGPKPGEIDCSAWPGTSPMLNPYSGMYQCLCPAGVTWDVNSRSCGGSAGQQQGAGGAQGQQAPAGGTVPGQGGPGGSVPGSGGGGPGGGGGTACPDGTIGLLGVCGDTANGH